MRRRHRSLVEKGCCGCWPSRNAGQLPSEPGEQEVVRHVHQVRGPPPPLTSPVPAIWGQLPPPNRRRLVWLLSEVLARQLVRLNVQTEEVGDAAPGSTTADAW